MNSRNKIDGWLSRNQENLMIAINLCEFYLSKVILKMNPINYYGSIKDCATTYSIRKLACNILRK